MANPAWPGTIPQVPLLSSFDERPRSIRINSSMDVGPPKSRRRYTKELRDQTWQFVMTETQRTAFDSFFYTTLSGGSLAFDHTDPVTDTTKTFRFTGEPTFRPLSGTRWLVSMEVQKQA